MRNMISRRYGGGGSHLALRWAFLSVCLVGVMPYSWRLERRERGNGQGDITSSAEDELPQNGKKERLGIIVFVKIKTTSSSYEEKKGRVEQE
jgi:hypothetical protein